MQLPKVGEILDGKVVKIMNYGAIIKLPNDNTGFLHISEISKKRIENIRDYLKYGQEVRVKVIAVKKEEKKVSLSIRKVDGGDMDKAIVFEATIKRFLKDSGEKLKQLQKNIENKQGGRRKKTPPKR